MSIFGTELTRNEVADMVGLSRLKFKTLVAEGKGPVYRTFGRTILFAEDKVKEWAIKYREEVYKESAQAQAAKSGNGKTTRKPRTATIADTSELLA